MVVEVVNIDLKNVINFTVSRGQIFRFYISPEEGETEHNDNMVLNVSLHGTLKSFVKSYVLGDGISINSKGLPQIEIDTSIFRESIDSFVCDWFPYGLDVSRERKKKFNVSFNDSCYGTE